MTTRTRKKATQAAQEWNRGLVGPASRPRPVTRPGECSTDGCGAVADEQDESDPRFTGWTRAGVYGSAEPDRMWCSGQCATYGIALAELRMQSATTNGGAHSDG